MVQIRKGNLSYDCGALSTAENKFAKFIIFNVAEPLLQADAEALFGDEAFYFYDETLQSRSPVTDGMKFERVSIKYLKDSTCQVVLKLTKGDVVSESTV